LRHTAAIWLRQRGGPPIWEAAGILGMAPEVAQDTYRPDYPGERDPRSAKRADEFRRPKRWSA